MVTKFITWNSKLFIHFDKIIPGTAELNDSKPNSCKFCYLEFENEEARDEHEIIHSNESQPFRCPQQSCKSRFKTKNYLKDHFRVHSGGKLFLFLGESEQFQQISNIKFDDPTFPTSRTALSLSIL